ncbi:NAD(P)-dependent oxidoreductase [Nocardioides ultimimeridianus]
MNYSVLGTGLMGSAVARALAAAPASTGAWNRTTARAEALADAGVTVHDDVASALADSDAVILMLVDLDAALEVLEDHLPALRGKSVINLMSGTPTLATRAAELVESHGGRYLDGTIQCYPSDIGGAASLVNFSGDRTVWDEHESALRAIAGGSVYVGEDPGAASVLDAALAGTFYTAGLAAFCEALAFLRGSGIDPSRPEVSLDYWFDLFRAQATQLVSELAKEEFASSEATIDIYLGAMRQWQSTMQAAGQRGTVMAAAVSNLQTAVDRGHGADGFIAQVLTASDPA